MGKLDGISNGGAVKSFFVAGFVVIALLAGTGTGWAQSVGGGIKVGANFATVSGDIEAEKSMRTGLVAGGFLTVPMGAMVAFQPEVLYSMQGVKGTEDDGTELASEIDEVQIPLLLRLGGNPGGSAGYFLVGPSIGIITSAKNKSGSEEEDFKDELKSTDIGVLVGAGISVNRFLIEARYTAGMTNLLDDDTEDHKSRVFSVLVGIGF